ncbi:hypothetical protein CC79DRAFT_1364886 [Sarocladium strictum]
MKFLNIFTVISAAAVATAAPLQISKRAIFEPSTFNELSISGGTAGGAAQAALARLGPLPQDLTTVEQSDIDFLDSVNSICNDAEKEAFNPAIDAADGEEADALQRGKIQNKVLKLTATILKLQIQQAQGKDDVADKLAEEETKLANNVSQDEEAAGLPATSLSFDAST